MMTLAIKRREQLQNEVEFNVRIVKISIIGEIGMTIRRIQGSDKKGLVT